MFGYSMITLAGAAVHFYFKNVDCTFSQLNRAIQTQCERHSTFGNIHSENAKVMCVSVCAVHTYMCESEYEMV